jgi:hypothetical protein
MSLRFGLSPEHRGRALVMPSARSADGGDGELILLEGLTMRRAARGAVQVLLAVILLGAAACEPRPEEVWPSDAGAAVNWGDGKAYFFKGDVYLRYDLAAHQVDPGYPRSIAEGWKGIWTSGIDAAAVLRGGPFGGDKVYFFKGKEFIRYDIASDRADDGYPKPIAGNWSGL